MEGSGSENYIPGFAPRNSVHEVIKTRSSSFYRTDLNRILQEKKISRLYLSGFSSDVCIRVTAFDAYNEGFEIILLKDCMHSLKEDFEESINYQEWPLKAKLE